MCLCPFVVGTEVAELVQRAVVHLSSFTFTLKEEADGLFREGFRDTNNCDTNCVTTVW